MAQRGMGVLYTRTADGGPLRSPPGPAERRTLVTRFYDPHHRALGDAVTSALDSDQACLIVDCHNFPSVALPYDLDQSPGRPEICIGTDAFHTPESPTASAVARFAAEGLSVAVNRPSSGALVPADRYARDNRVASIMIEINRGLYMDEETGSKKDTFDEVGAIVRRVVRGLLG